MMTGILTALMTTTLWSDSWLRLRWTALSLWILGITGAIWGGVGLVAAPVVLAG